jgi:hypothetical protein
MKGKSYFLLLLCFFLLSNNLVAQTSEKETEEHCKVFFNVSNDTYSLFAMHQPSLKDCNYIFKDDWGFWLFRNFNIEFCKMADLYANATGPAAGNIFMEFNAVRSEKFNTSDVLNDECDICPGAMSSYKDYLKPNIDCYIITFLENKGDEYGLSVAFFSYIDNRWVLFPIN